jgi:hypothetical protein
MLWMIAVLTLSVAQVPSDPLEGYTPEWREHLLDADTQTTEEDVRAFLQSSRYDYYVRRIEITRLESEIADRQAQIDSLLVSIGHAPRHHTRPAPPVSPTNWMGALTVLTLMLVAVSYPYRSRHPWRYRVLWLVTIQVLIYLF